MNRTPWTVDEELSRLKAEIKDKQTEPPNSEWGTPREDGPHQQIQGHHNVQVAGDLTVHAHTAADPNHPQAIPCPRCRALTYRRSDSCAHCRINLSGYRLEQANREKRRRLGTVIWVCGVPGFLCVVAGTQYFSGTVGLYGLWVGGALLAAAGLAALRIRQIAENEK